MHEKTVRHKRVTTDLSVWIEIALKSASPLANVLLLLLQAHQSPGAGFPPLTSPHSFSDILPSPSPGGGGGILDPSPGAHPSLHVPSPGSFVPAPSPSSLGIHMPSPASQFVSPQGNHHHRCCTHTALFVFYCYSIAVMCTGLISTMSFKTK